MWKQADCALVAEMGVREAGSLALLQIACVCGRSVAAILWILNNVPLPKVTH